MLRTNSKLAQQRIQDYVTYHFQPYDEDADNKAYNFDNYTCLCQYLWDKFIQQVYNSAEERRYFNHNIQEAFDYWIGGLPGILNPSYLYQESAIDILGDMLDQTITERNKYTKMDAQETLTYLIFKSVRSHVTNPYG